MHDDFDDFTLDDLRAAHPGAAGPADGNAWIAALEEGWRPSQIIRSAELYGQLLSTSGGTPRSVERWLQTSLGRPPGRNG